MSKLPQVKPRQLLKAIQKIGFKIKKRRGSHIDLRHLDGRRTTISMHNKTVPKGTLKKILNQTELTVEKLKKLL
jgi:predicted RNA binding protein YcfA (HicA-like mRNA interferase family)